MARINKEEIKNSFVEKGFMSESEELLEVVQTTRKVGKSIFATWKQGWGYYTNEQLIVISGMLGDDVCIPYKSIVEMNKCTQYLMPMGIQIVYKDSNNVTRSEKISTMNRQKYMDLMQENSNR